MAEKDINIDRICDAKIPLAAIFFDGLGVKQDYKKSYECCNYVLNNSKKEDNILFAHKILSIMYFYGYGVEQNYKKAYESCCYIIEKNKNKEDICEAKALLSYIYFYGLGIEKNYKKAYEYANFVVENSDNKQIISICRLVLGSFYFGGFGVVKPNFEEVFKNYNYVLENTSDKDLILPVKYILAISYYKGLGTETNYKKAKEYCEDILKNKISDNLREILNLNKVKSVLAEIYTIGGYGVDKDYKKATIIYEEILKSEIKDEQPQGHILYLLGYTYCCGYAEEIDFIKGYNYIKESANLGYESAKKLVDEVNKKGLAKTFIGFDQLMLFDKSNVENVVSGKELKIFQVLDSSFALATIHEDYSYVVVFLIGTHYDYFYDDQKIKVPCGKQIKQIGIYRYETKDGIIKTVPAVAIKKIEF